MNVPQVGEFVFQVFACYMLEGSCYVDYGVTIRIKVVDCWCVCFDVRRTLLDIVASYGYIVASYVFGLAEMQERTFGATNDIDKFVELQHV